MDDENTNLDQLLFINDPQKALNEIENIVSKLRDDIDFGFFPCPFHAL